jgi:hypothetical protein
VIPRRQEARVPCDAAGAAARRGSGCTAVRRTVSRSRSIPLPWPVAGAGRLAVEAFEH